MKLTIADNICSKHNMSPEEVLFALLVKWGIDITQLTNQMVEKEMIVKDGLFSTFSITPRWNDEVDIILLDSEVTTKSDDELKELYCKLKKIYPKGLKPGTSQYWWGNTKEVTLKLKKFFKVFGNTYSEEEILAATHKYVESFNGQYSFMRLLKNFIYKSEKKLGEDGNNHVSEISDLASFLENSDHESLIRDWTASLR